MKEKNGYYYWNKEDKEKISQYFSTVEYTCRCSFESCKEQKISKNLIEKLTWIRNATNKPIEILSGYRCQEHQDSLKASGKETAIGISQHTLGNAADIRSPSLTIYNLIPFIDKQFDSYGIANGFSHVDTRPKKLDGTKRIWWYKDSPGKF